jgi:hypothetical protein
MYFKKNYKTPILSHVYNKQCVNFQTSGKTSSSAAVQHISQFGGIDWVQFFCDRHVLTYQTIIQQKLRVTNDEIKKEWTRPLPITCIKKYNLVTHSMFPQFQSKQNRT